jgi:hypothetical protein
MVYKYIIRQIRQFHSIIRNGISYYIIYANITNAKNTNIKIKGNRTRNHAKFGAPALQIKFNIHVQNAI